MKYAIFFVWLGIFGCTRLPISQSPGPTEVPAGTTNADCTVVAEILVLANQTITLPAEGRFVVESHLATTSDSFLALWPVTSTDSITPHLQRACQILSLVDQSVGPNCVNVYGPTWTREWTPPEGGVSGQGSVGNLKPSAVQEMYSGNMFWQGNKPAAGTKFLACVRTRCVVVATGFETGPRDPVYLGGLQPEVHYLLRSTDQSLIKWGRLKNQSLAYGPVECQ